MFLRFTSFIRQIFINRDNKAGKFKQLEYIRFFFVISRKNIEWRRAHYSRLIRALEESHIDDTLEWYTEVNVKYSN